MKLQAVRIKTEDFPSDQRKLVEGLGSILNPFLDRIVLGSSKNFTVDDNLPFEFKTVDVRVDVAGLPTNAANVVQNLTILTGLTGLKGYICLNATDLSGSNAHPAHTPFVVFTVVNQTVTVKKITGLTAGKQYRLVLLGIS